jgi:hypothetical protein
MFLWSSLILGRPTICKAACVFSQGCLARVIILQFVCAVEDWFSTPTRLYVLTPQKLSARSKDAGCCCMQVRLSRHFVNSVLFSFIERATIEANINQTSSQSDYFFDMPVRTFILSFMLILFVLILCCDTCLL